MSLFAFGHKQAAGAVVAAIDKVEVVGVGVEKEVELVADEVHLEDGFFDIDGLAAHALDACNAVFAFFLFVGHVEIGDELGFVDAFFDAGFVLAQLADEDIDAAVERVVDLLRAFFGPQDHAAEVDGDLNGHAGFLGRGGDFHLSLVGIGSEEAGELLELFLGVRLEGWTCVAFAAYGCDFHWVSPFEVVIFYCRLLKIN